MYDDLLRISHPSGAPISAVLDDLYAQPSASAVLGSEISYASAQVGSTVAVDSGTGASRMYSIAGTLSSAPLFSFTSNPQYAYDRDALVSIPAYVRMMSEPVESIEDLQLAAWHLRLHSDANPTARRCFLKHVAACGLAVEDFESGHQGTQSVQTGTLEYLLFAWARR